MGRKTKICPHGLARGKCKECQKIYMKEYNENFLKKGVLKNGKIHEGYIKKDAQFPNYDLSAKARAFVRKEYHPKNYITRYFLENCVCGERKGTLADFCYSEVPL